MNSEEMLEPWRTLASAVPFENRWLRIVVDQVELPSGRQYEYTRLQPAGVGVGIIGFDPAGRVLLEREYRHGVGDIIWQIPGGFANPGEELAAAGLRELQEETGYGIRSVTADNLRYLGVIWDNPAMGTAQSHIYAAWGLELVGAVNRDRFEQMTLHWESQAWLKEAVRSGEIRDRVVVAAVAYLLLNGWM
jgi:ADP-ribose pyrophosphatase